MTAVDVDVGEKIALRAEKTMTTAVGCPMRLEVVGKRRSSEAVFSASVESASGVSQPFHGHLAHGLGRVSPDDHTSFAMASISAAS